MVRAPAVAGRFYPGEPDILKTLVADLLVTHATAEPQSAIAVLVPHAGYVYSGGVAAAVYSAVRIPARVILLGPNHTGLGPPLSLWDRGIWEFPGGEVRVDEEFGHLLRKSCPELVPDPLAHRYEHCLEVQIPFLEARVEHLRVTPVVLGTSRLETLHQLGHAIAEVVRQAGEAALVVISSDMTHYEPAEVAARKDHLAVEAMEAMDAEGLHQVVVREEISMCGFAPAVAGLAAAREMGARSGRLVRYAHSGVVSGDNTSVVGYAGMVFS